MCSGYSCTPIADLRVTKCPIVQGTECAGKGVSSLLFTESLVFLHQWLYTTLRLFISFMPKRNVDLHMLSNSYSLPFMFCLLFHIFLKSVSNVRLSLKMHFMLFAQLDT